MIYIFQSLIRLNFLYRQVNFPFNDFPFTEFQLLIACYTFLILDCTDVLEHSILLQVIDIHSLYTKCM